MNCNIWPGPYGIVLYGLVAIASIVFISLVEFGFTIIVTWFIEKLEKKANKEDKNETKRIG